MGNGWNRSISHRRYAPSTCRRTSECRAATSAFRWRPVNCCSSSTTTPGLPAPDAPRRVAELFAEHPRIGMVQTRLVDPAAPEAPRYWVPRLRKGDPARSSTVMYVLEAALAVRRPVFEEVGGFGDFGYAHEGHRPHLAGVGCRLPGLVRRRSRHLPPGDLADPARRVPTAQRPQPGVAGPPQPPWALVPAYLGSWTLVEWSRVRHDAEAWRTWRAGFAEGWRTPAGERRPVAGARSGS